MDLLLEFFFNIKKNLKIKLYILGLKQNNFQLGILLNKLFCKYKKEKFVLYSCYLIIIIIF